MILLSINIACTFWPKSSGFDVLGQKGELMTPDDILVVGILLGFIVFGVAAFAIGIALYYGLK